MLPTSSIYSTRLVINDFREPDISLEYLGWLNDHELMRFSSQRFLTHTHETSMAYLDSFTKGASRFLAIRAKSTSDLVGTATVYWDRTLNSADVGILVGKLRFGYGREAFAAITSALLDSGVYRVTAGTASGNRAMIAVAQAAGMREVVRELGDPYNRYFEVTATP